MKDKHLTQVDIAKAIGRKAQSYVSDRLTGKKSFLISELDIIAPMVGLMRVYFMPHMIAPTPARAEPIKKVMAMVRFKSMPIRLAAS